MRVSIQSGGSEEDGVGDNSEIHMLFHVDMSEFYGEIHSPFLGQGSDFWKKLGMENLVTFCVWT